MSITFGNTRTATLALLDEYDTDGVIQTTADVTVKIREFTNKAMIDLATSNARIPGEKYIVQAPVKNEVTYDTSSIITFKPGDSDISISLLNAKACYFEIIGPATVVIEETADGVTYSTLETITVSSSVTTFTEYRRLITPSLSTNTVRLRFTGSYIFYLRNYILYPYAWSTAAEVQQHRPYFIYDLPTDFLELNYVMVKKNTRQYIPYKDYIIRPDKKISFNRYDAPVEFLVHYWRYPTLFTYTGIEVTDDAMVYGIDSANSTYRISDEAALIVPNYVAGYIFMSEGVSGLSIGLTLLNLYEAKKANIIGYKIGFSNKVENVSGW